MYSMDDFGKDFVEFFRGPMFLVAMAVMSTYLVAYAKFIERAAARDKRNEENRQLGQYVFIIFWERLLRRDFFAILNVAASVDGVTGPGLPSKPAALAIAV